MNDAKGKVYLCGLCTLLIMMAVSCSKDDHIEPDPHGDLSPYVGNWEGQTYYRQFGGGWPMTLQIQADGTVTGQLELWVAGYQMFTNYTGEAWAEHESWHFYAELKASGATDDDTYLGGAIDAEGRLVGWISEGEPLADPPDDNYMFFLWKE